MKVVLVHDATTDLREIGDYVAENNAQAAVRLVSALRRACLDLGKFPHKFPIVGESNGSAVRRRPHGAYLIFYRVIDKGVEVLRVMHSARDHERILFPED